MASANVTKEALLEQIRKAVNIQRLNDLVECITDEVSEKNRQYGDAWQLYAILTPLIRIREKLVRAENVSMRNGAMIVTVKSCDDLLKELMDIIGYSMLAMLWIDANMDISIDKAVDACKKVADHPEDEEEVAMQFPVTLAKDGKYEAKAEDLMSAAIDMFGGNLRITWDGLLPKGWHSVEDDDGFPK